MTLQEAEAKVEEWLVRTPLYEELTNDAVEQLNALRALADRERPFDMYCVHCKGPSTFVPSVQDNIPSADRVTAFLREGLANPLFDVKQFQVVAVCARVSEHVARFVFLHRKGASLQKIGQYPSLADLSIPETSQFVKVLGQDRVRELNKAIGLAAHGVGVGSYIYLRRIFESLVEEAHGEARKDTGWDEEAYQRLRVSERIPILKAHLPAFLVEHPQLYGILSRHIHELSEDECRRNFDAMKEAILIIARDKLKAHDEMEHRKHTAKLLQQINSTIKG